jgi:predicted PhzF superfamily epimerase YddE/YHI9
MNGSHLEVEVLRVFCQEAGAGGNHLGLVFDTDTDGLAHEQRLMVAAELGFSETIFIEADAQVRIFTPTTELPFAGHPLVGAAWRLGAPLLRTRAGVIHSRASNERAWIVARPEHSPAWETRQLDSPGLLDAMRAPTSGHVQYWTWQNEDSGLIRARVFAPDYGIAEDPATGSAAIVLCAQLARPIVIEQGAGSVIEQGAGSVIEARPREDGAVELGGRVVSDGMRLVGRPVAPP